MFQLYIGLVRDNEWYNYAKIDEIKGGALAVLDGIDNSGSAKMYNLIKKSVSKLYTEDGKEYPLTDFDYKEIKMRDGWKIAREVMRQFTRKEKPIFDEYFYCKICSTPGNEKYTRIEESWDNLIEKGFIDEIYLDRPEDLTALGRWKTELPDGIHIDGGKTIQGGTYTNIIREYLSMEDMIKIQKIPDIEKNNVSKIYAVWDMQTFEIENMSIRDFNVLVRRNTKDSFYRKYLTHQEDIDAMEQDDIDNNVGLIADYRPITCSTCHSDIDSGLDFTNFFSFLGSKQKSQKNKPA